MGWRDPLSFSMNVTHPLLQAATNLPRRPAAIIGRNQLLWDLGLNTSLMTNHSAVGEKIRQLDTQFSFVLLAERFDESLVMLARLLCWDLEQVRYLKQNARKASKVTNITKEARDTLTQWLEADYRLYNHFR